MSKAACCFKIKSCDAVAEGALAEGRGDVQALLFAVENVPGELSPQLERKIVKAADDLAALAKQYREKAKEIAAEVGALIE